MRSRLIVNRTFNAVLSSFAIGSNRNTIPLIREDRIKPCL
jgi:hypothetical protein